MVGWERAFEVIKLLRRHRNAPVDEFGPRSIADSTASRDVFQYQVLCALQLSSQTKDQNTSQAIKALQAHGLTVESIAQTSEAVLQELIRPVGFYRRKATYMKQTAQMLIDKHFGVVPGELADLLALPGIGPKMAHLTLAEAFDNHESGIGVDTHCHRIANQLGWAKSTTPVQTQAQLEKLFAKEDWYWVNLELVGLGQMLQQQKQYRAHLVHSLCTLESEDDFKDAVSVLKRLGFKLTKEEEEGNRKKTTDQPEAKKSRHFPSE